MNEERIDISGNPFVMRVVSRCAPLLNYLKKNKYVEIFLGGILCGYSPTYFRNTVLPILRYLYSDCLVVEKGRLYWVCKE